MDKKLGKTLVKRMSLCYGEDENVHRLFHECSIITGAGYGENSTDEVKQTELDLSNLQVSDSMFCNTCSLELTSRSHQVDHYQSDWHRFNLKRRLKGQNPLKENEFDPEKMESRSASESASSASDNDEDVKEEETGEKQAEEPAENSSPRKSATYRRSPSLRLPHVFMQSTNREVFSVWRAVLYSGKRDQLSPSEVAVLAQKIFDNLNWCIVMIAGGHFAAAVFSKNQVIAHKTFHRYVIRAKRGTVQSTCDSQSGMRKSAGAAARRHHEAALAEEVRALLASWSPHILTCSRIFVRAVGASDQVLFRGSAAPFSMKDLRVCRIPFPTRRPTHEELLRVHEQLSTVYWFGENENILNLLLTESHADEEEEEKTEEPNSTAAEEKDAKLSEEAEVVDQKQTTTEDIQAGKDEEVEAEECDDTVLTMTMQEHLTEDLQEFDNSPVPKKSGQNKRGRKNKKKGKQDTGGKEESSVLDKFAGYAPALYGACKAGDTEHVMNLIQELQQVTGDSLHDVLSSPIDPRDKTLLHIAAFHGHTEVISLLLDHGASPCAKDMSEVLPYTITKNKEVRNHFRRYMAKHPDKFDYAAAQIPGPLTEEMENERKAKEAEKKKAQRKLRDAKLKEKKRVEAVAKAEEEEKQRFLNLSDREKRALAAERRLIEQCKEEGNQVPGNLCRCFQCGKDITGKVPFEYLNNKFCSPACLKVHRTKAKEASQTANSAGART